MPSRHWLHRWSRRWSEYSRCRATRDCGRQERSFSVLHSRAVNALLGGWQLTSLARWTSGFPISVDNGYAFPTNWELEGNAVQTRRSRPDSRANRTVRPTCLRIRRPPWRHSATACRGKVVRSTASGVTALPGSTWGSIRSGRCGTRRATPSSSLGGVQCAQPAPLRCTVTPATDRPVRLVRQLHQPVDQSARDAVRAAVSVLAIARRTSRPDKAAREPRG